MKQARTILREVFGYADFRLNQEAIIQSTISGKDTLVIMPTGGGKSLCYQVPALMNEGLTLVISPLLALMADQVTALQANNIAAAYVNSTQTAAEKRDVFQQIEKGTLRLLYISPEKALAPAFLKYIQTKSVALVAIDEAHCVSIWGNDFRPEYARLRNLVAALPETPVMALTATADKATQRDIAKQLRLRDPQLFLSSFERKNITVKVLPGQNRLQQIHTFLKNHRKEPGIIYCLSRKSTEKLAGQLQERGYNAAFFHAEMSNGSKKHVQTSFQKDEIQIVCATIAFGMGIDKPNIRWVIHYNLPKNIESYYQEIGRSGRDGSSAEALLFFSFYDVSIFKRFIDESESPAQFREVQHSKLQRIWEFTQATSCRTNFILNYFSEYRTTPCGHCDLCLNPPAGFNGTVYAKNAIQVCHESKQQVGIQMMTDILRASGRRDILEKGYHNLPSYGVGREVPRADWLHYITQLINQGILEIDYTEKSVLKLTRLSANVINGSLSPTLTRPLTQEDFAARKKPASKKGLFEDSFKEALRKIRSTLARREKVAPYIIFNDKVLEELVQKRPLTLAEFGAVQGIGVYKQKKYGPTVIQVVQNFIVEQEHSKNVKGRSFLLTLHEYKRGKTPQEIAADRNLNVATIFGHLIHLYEKDEKINLEKYISEQEIVEIKDAWTRSAHSEKLSDIMDHMGDEVPIYKIKLALAILRRQADTVRS